MRSRLARRISSEPAPTSRCRDPGDGGVAHCQAAAQLEREGISVEVIDPRTLRPLDEDTILTSVRKTSRLVVAHEGWKTGGFGAEISAIVTEKAFDWLDAPVARVGALDVPMPFNDRLESQVIPDQQTIVDAINSLYR